MQPLTNIKKKMFFFSAIQRVKLAGLKKELNYVFDEQGENNIL